MYALHTAKYSTSGMPIYCYALFSVGETETHLKQTSCLLSEAYFPVGEVVNEKIPKNPQKSQKNKTKKIENTV